MGATLLLLPIQEKTCLLAYHHYLELNPERAGMVLHPAVYCYLALGQRAEENAGLVKLHSLYLALGLDADGR